MLQDGFDFGAPNDSAIVDGEVERLDAEAITNQQQSLLAMVINDDRKLSSQLIDK